MNEFYVSFPGNRPVAEDWISDGFPQNGQEDDSQQARVDRFALPVMEGYGEVPQREPIHPFKLGKRKHRAKEEQLPDPERRNLGLPERRIDWLACPRIAYVDFAGAYAHLSEGGFIRENRALKTPQALPVPRNNWRTLAFLKEDRALFKAEDISFGIAVCMYGEREDGRSVGGMGYADGTVSVAVGVTNLVHGMIAQGVVPGTIRTYLVGGRINDDRDPNMPLGSLLFSKELMRATSHFHLRQIALHMNEGIDESITVVMRTDRIEYRRYRVQL